MEIEPELDLDPNGHLLNYETWSKQIGTKLANQDNLKLTSEHWLVINLVRELYLQTETTPPMRLLIKMIKKHLGDSLASSRKLYQLFPDGPVRLASRYAGLPKPKHCM